MRYYFLLLLTLVFSVACSKSDSPPPPVKSVDKNPSVQINPSVLKSVLLRSKIPGVEPSLKISSCPYVKVEVIKSQASNLLIEAPARIEFKKRGLSKVGAVVAGRVNKVHVQIGDHVKIGMILADLESPQVAQMRAEVARTQAELHHAQDQMSRQNLMRQTGVGLEIERVAAKTQLEEAQADYTRSMQTIHVLGGGAGGSMLSVRSPIDGVVLDVTTVVGSAVEAGTALFEVGKPDALRIVADVFGDDLAFIQKNSSVELSIPTLSKTITGHVTAISGQMDADLRRASVYIDIDNDMASLKAGMYGKAMIKTILNNEILLPNEAVLIKDGDKTIVYVEVEPHVFSPRRVEVGEIRDDLIPVLSGLKEGDRVVTSGALLLDSEAQMLL
jgi:cobalt-zinc-cadmium efflux system membrane fusion protein